MKKGRTWAAILAAVLLPCWASSWAQQGHAEHHEPQGHGEHHDMLSDEHLQRMQSHMEEMLDRVQQMRATDGMEERRRLMEEFHQEMQMMEREERRDRMCPMCPMMEDDESTMEGRDHMQHRDGP